MCPGHELPACRAHTLSRTALQHPAVSGERGDLVSPSAEQTVDQTKEGWIQDQSWVQGLVRPCSF